MCVEGRGTKVCDVVGRSNCVVILLDIRNKETPETNVTASNTERNVKECKE